jgi:two-component system CheB/CheR fusion protein
MAEYRPDAGAAVVVDRLVAIGASAGGLDALERFFGALPDDPDAAFVVVQHLSPDYKSMMDSLLARHTSMPVEMAEHDQALQVGHVYLIPPGKTMTLEDGRLKLAPKPPNQLVLPIDVFLRSAAAGFRERLVAVILSGTGSDGSRGATAVKDAGGYVIAQNPDTSRFDGMPRSAIATGIVDAVLDVESMGAHLATHLAMPLPSPSAQDTVVRGFPATEVELLDELLHVLHDASGIAFRDYKPSTLHRRILRRMHMCGCDTLQAYLAFSRSRPEEVHALQRDLLIPVTMFFRDIDAFEAVRAYAVLPTVQASEPGRPIRVWVAGCATGEEAYSIAMLFDEASSELRRWPAFKLFATDAEEQCLATASAGYYPRGIADEVDESRLARYFDAREEGFVVRKELRQNLVFARHNVVEDPPFTQIDLICCRNLLIYLKPEAQERVLRRFQYALRPGGFLFLGSSETLGPVGRDFEVVDARSRLYRMRHGRSSALTGGATPALRARTIAGFDGRPGLPVGRTPDSDYVVRARDLLFSQYAPPTLLLGDRLELIDVFGNVRDILAFREGGVSLDAPGLLPAHVSPLVKMLAHRVAKDLEPARVDQVALTDDGKGPRYSIVMRPLSRAGGPWPMLASFELDDRSAPAEPGAPIDLPAESSLHIQTLEQELAHTRDNLQATIEELETANEELQATNEELMATNEELQSTNEELQSVNEELYAVNAENQERIELLNRANLDLDSLSRATRVPTVFLDADLLLTRFTQEATQLFGFRETDLGRSIEEFSSALDYPQFHADLQDAVMHGSENTREVPARDGRWFQVRVLACAPVTGVPSRALATFLDITSLRNVLLLQSVLDSLPEQVAVLDAGGVIRLVNAAWRRFAADNGGSLAARSDIGRNYLAVCEPTSEDPYAAEALAGLRSVLEGRSEAFSLRYPCHSPTMQRWFLMHVRPLRQPGGGAVVSHVDVTDFSPSPA